MTTPTRSAGLVTALLQAGLTFGAFATVAGFAAPLVPLADMFNHVRPLTLVGFVVLLGLGLLIRSARPWRWWAGLGVAVNLLLVAAGAWQRAPVVQFATSTTLTVLTWNVNWDNADVARGAPFIREHQPDVLLLQELTRAQTPRLLEAIGDLYPHRVLCEATRCTGALLSRHPMSDVKRRPLKERAHGSIVATVTLGELSPLRVRVAGLHMQFPLKAWEQAEHIDQVIGEVHDDLSRALPYVIAGDFNLTPWSWGMTRLTRATGLTRHAGDRPYAATWPDVPVFGIPFAMFPIDHVFSTAHFETRSITIAPGAGSDHRMVMVSFVSRR